MLTAERLRTLLDYDPETGIFRWNVTVKETGRGGRKGDQAGCFGTPDYVRIRIEKRLYLAHRLAWLYVYGSFPPGQIDHKNGNKKDNRIGNLRVANHSQNACNRGVRADSASRLKGAYFDHRERCWIARIRAEGKLLNLGRFASAEAAHAAYSQAAVKYFGEFARVA